MSLRRGPAPLDPFQSALWRALNAEAFVAGLPDYDRSRSAFVESGAAWLWREHPGHVRGLSADAQLALIDDAYVADKRTASAMMAALFPSDGDAPPVGL